MRVASGINTGQSFIALTTSHQCGEMFGKKFGPRAENLTPDVLAQQLSIIIPARNEEFNLPTLLRSIASQSVTPREIIVVDDGSADHTSDVALRFGAKVVVPQPLPAGWRGKTWACHQGARAASGNLLMFLDADTWFEPDGLARVLAGYVVQHSRCPEHQNRLKPELQTESDPALCGAFSVGPFHTVQKLYEELSLFFNLCMVVGTVPYGLFGSNVAC